MRDRMTRGRALQLLLVLGVLISAETCRGLRAGEASPSLPAEASCDLSRQDCDLLLGDQPVRIHLDSRPVRSGEPIPVTLSTTEPGWVPVQAEIQGHSMYMGRLPLLLSPVADHRWQGVIQVPACMHEVMVWQLDIRWHKDGRQAQTRQLFSVRRD